MWLKNEKGFYMAELIISLSGWLLISGVLVPIFIQVNKQSIEIQEKSEALHILYEYMQTVTIENPVKENKILYRGSYPLRNCMGNGAGGWKKGGFDTL